MYNPSPSRRLTNPVQPVEVAPGYLQELRQQLPIPGKGGIFSPEKAAREATLAKANGAPNADSLFSDAKQIFQDNIFQKQMQEARRQGEIKKAQEEGFPEDMPASSGVGNAMTGTPGITTEMLNYNSSPERMAEKAEGIFYKPLSERRRFAEGGEIEGLGGPTDDMVPAMVDGQQPIDVSDGEFIMPEVAKRYWGIKHFNEMIQEAMTEMGEPNEASLPEERDTNAIPGFADGGEIDIISMIKRMLSSSEMNPNLPQSNRPSVAIPYSRKTITEKPRFFPRDSYNSLVSKNGLSGPLSAPDFLFRDQEGEGLGLNSNEIADLNQEQNQIMAGLPRNRSERPKHKGYARGGEVRGDDSNFMMQAMGMLQSLMGMDQQQKEFGLQQEQQPLQMDLLRERILGERQRRQPNVGLQNYYQSQQNAQDLSTISQFLPKSQYNSTIMQEIMRRYPQLVIKTPQQEMDEKYSDPASQALKAKIQQLNGAQ